MSKPIRLAVTALTGSVVAGTVNAKGDGLNGQQDVSRDFLKAVVDKADWHGGTFDIAGEGKKWTVTVEVVKQDAATIEQDAELPEEWLPINDAPWADDLIWLRKGDSIDGPRAIDNDDYDKYTHYAPCEPPSLRLSTLAKRGGE